jgi:hypothetical protein
LCNKYEGEKRLAQVLEGASLVREFQGAYINVLTYKQQCSTCAYLAQNNSIVFSMLPYDSYDTEGFVCPCCSNYQAVRVRLELEGEWVNGLREY